MNNILSLGKNCCGCNACEQVCPTNCIKFDYDNEGFLYPTVDESKCISCGKCVKHCPILSDVKCNSNPDVYAAKYIDKKVVIKSSSGGVFMPLAKKFVDNGGVVFGCAFDENLVARHIAVEKAEDLYKLQSSKYVQSDIRGIYSQVKTALTQNKPTLFSGTGCQVAGLMSFLGKEYDNLFTIDIVCHGTPSPKLFEYYTDWLGKKLGGKLIEYNFRSKEKHGWDKYFKASTADKSITKYGLFDPYYSAFMKCTTYRESCYNCKYANAERVGDISLADFWGIEKFDPKFYDKNGVSLILVNSERGKKEWIELSKQLDYIPSTLELAKEYNKNLSSPSKRPKERDNIFDGFDSDFDTYAKTKLKIGSTWKKRIKMLIPISLKGKIKRMLSK